jgi:hypothetical protein
MTCWPSQPRTRASKICLTACASATSGKLFQCRRQQSLALADCATNRGRSDLRIEQGEQARTGVACPGHLFLVPPRDPTRRRWVNPADTLYIGFPKRLILQPPQNLSASPKQIFRAKDFLRDPLLSSLLQTLHLEAVGNESHNLLMVQSIATQVIVHCLRRYGASTESRKNGKGLTDQQIRIVPEFIEENLDRSISVTHLPVPAYRESHGPSLLVH